MLCLSYSCQKLKVMVLIYNGIISILKYDAISSKIK